MRRKRLVKGLDYASSYAGYPPQGVQDQPTGIFQTMLHGIFHDDMRLSFRPLDCSEKNQVMAPPR